MESPMFKLEQVIEIHGGPNQPVQDKFESCLIFQFPNSFNLYIKKQDGVIRPDIKNNFNNINLYVLSRIYY